MTRRRCHFAGSRIGGGCLAWIMLVAAPASWVAGQQDVSAVDDEDIVLPTVVLELDEPGAGGLEVSLPLDIEVVAPEIWPPLPEAGDLDIDLRTAVAAPTLEFAPAAVEGLAQSLVAEAYVSVGTTISTDEDLRGLPLAQLDSGLSVLGSGSGSDFALAFTHSLRDGVRNHRRPGEGANTQRYALAGSIVFGLGPGQLDVEAGMVNSEQGFGALCRNTVSEVCQELEKARKKNVADSARRNSSESQTVAAAASYRLPLGDQVRLTSAVDLRSEVTTLTGSNAETHSELSAAPELTLDWSLEPVDLRVNARYLIRPYEELGGTRPRSERCPPEESGDLLCTRHKVNAGVTGSIDLGGQMGLELSLAWSWRTDRRIQGKAGPAAADQYGGHRFVPQAVISGTPTSWFTFRVAGGYEVRELGVASITDRFRYVEPTQVDDDEGWFAFGRAQFGLGELTGLSELAVVATTRLATHSAAPEPSDLNHRNLYDLRQKRVELSVVPGVGLSLGLGDVVEIRANVSGEVMTDNAPKFTPQVRSELEVEAHTPDDGLGVRLNAAMDHNTALGGLQTPEVEIEGLWRQGATTVTLTLTDLLELANSPRRDWAPYLRPGFGAAASVQLAL